MQHLRLHGSGRGRALLGGAVLLLGACGRARSSPIDTREITDSRSAPGNDAEPPAGDEPAPVSPSTDGESPPVGAEPEPPVPPEAAACPAELQFFPLGRPPENYYPRFDAVDVGSSYVFWSLDWGGNDYRVQSFRWTPELGNTALNELDEELPPPEGDEQIIDLDPFIYAVSGDGTTAVGTAFYNDESMPGFRWTPALGLELLDFRPSWVNRDGSALFAFENAELLRWTEGAGTTLLLRDVSSLLVSADAAVIAGKDADARAFRWTVATGSVLLGTFPGGAGDAQPLLLNDAGDVIVVTGTDRGTGLPRLALWTTAGGMQALDGFPELPADVFAVPTAMSPDGRVLVGNLSQNEPPQQRAFRWTEATGLQEIGPVGRGSQVTYVSPSADVVFGNVGDGNTFNTGFRWSEATGTEELTDTVQPRNVGGAGYVLIGNAFRGPFVRSFDAPSQQARSRLAEIVPPSIVPSGWTNPVLSGISADGRLLVGEADNPQGEREGWVMRLLEACAGP